MCEYQIQLRSACLLSVGDSGLNLVGLNFNEGLKTVAFEFRTPFYSIRYVMFVCCISWHFCFFALLSLFLFFFWTGGVLHPVEPTIWDLFGCQSSPRAILSDTSLNTTIDRRETLSLKAAVSLCYTAFDCRIVSGHYCLSA